jgi:outer membrane protein assembly factor BamA
MPVLLEIRPSFTLERTLRYYGMGNASSASPPPNPAITSFEYSHTHPTGLVDARFKIVDHVAGTTGVRYTFTSNDVVAGSKLAYDIRYASPEVKSLIGPTGPESILQFLYGIELDTRDNETSPHKGTYDRVALRLSPGGTAGVPFRYGEATGELRGFVPLGSKRATLAIRVVGDILFGNAPFTDLSCVESVYALGGSNGVRGVPAQRYYGKVKAFGNVETRVKLFDVHAFSKTLAIGAVAFFDGGRVWTDTTPEPQLDGSGIGLKYGLGGGLRVTSGTAFVVRADVAWSPDATPVGVYFVAGESF